MERISEGLQCPIIIEGRRPFSPESQFPEKLDFLLGRIAAEGSILKEFSKPRLFVKPRSASFESSPLGSFKNFSMAQL
jgi:hypothetical protein